ncbi:MAG: protein translocase subunit SecD [Actinobacteria bacterium]|nr:protein translocase subunit SecD [Actinomycetota bacterium]
MTDKRKYIITILLVLAIVGGAIAAIYPIDRSTKLGLDLRGGVSVILTAKDTPGAPVNEDSMRQAEMIIRNRVDGLGVGEPEIQRQGSRNILVQLPGIRNQDEAIKIMGKPAVLQFAVVNEKYAKVPAAGVDPNTGKKINLNLNDLKRQGEPVLGPVLMTGKDLKSAQATYGGQIGSQPIVEMQFTSEGARRFAEITTANVNKRLAMILDGEIKEAPTIQQPITGGSAQITGIGSIEDAKNTALVLQTGSIPVKLEMSEIRNVGPTLGQDSLRAGLIAGLVGLALIAMFMLVTYRGLGAVTVAALVVFAALYWGLIAVMSRYYQWNLTLPGIAGIIVSIGIAADSSIIFYERIKDEIRAGKTFRTAVDSGFWNAFRTMLDADFVTWLTAGVLFLIGIGTVRGFALTLSLGLIVDMFTMFFFTRSVLGVIAHMWPKKSPKLLGLEEVPA